MPNIIWLDFEGFLNTYLFLPWLVMPFNFRPLFRMVIIIYFKIYLEMFIIWKMSFNQGDQLRVPQSMFAHYMRVLVCYIWLLQQGCYVHVICMNIWYIFHIRILSCKCCFLPCFTCVDLSIISYSGKWFLHNLLFFRSWDEAEWWCCEI